MKQVVSKFRSIDPNTRQVLGVVAVPLPRFAPETILTRAEYDEYKASGAIHYDDRCWDSSAVVAMAHRFLVQSREVDLEHDRQPGYALILESAIRPDLDDSWCVLQQILDDSAWDTIIEHETTAGNSIHVYGLDTPVPIKIQEPDGALTECTLTYIDDPTPCELSITATPAINVPFLSIMRSIGRSATDLPIADTSTLWDSAKAVKRIREWATTTTVVDGEEKKTVDWTKVGQAFFYVDSENADTMEGYKLPFADIIDGKLTAISQAIFTIGGILEGSMGGVDLPADDRPKVMARVQAWYHRLNRFAPWEADEKGNNKGKDRSMNEKIEVTTEEKGVLEKLFGRMFGRNRSVDVVAANAEEIVVPTFLGRWAKKEYDESMSEAHWALRDVIYDIIANEKIADKAAPIGQAIDEYKALIMTLISKSVAVGVAAEVASATMAMCPTSRSIPEVIKRIERTCQTKNTPRADEVAAVTVKMSELCNGLDTALQAFDAAQPEGGLEGTDMTEVEKQAVTDLTAALAAAQTQMAEMRAEIDALKNPPEESEIEDVERAEPEPNPELETLKAQMAALETEKESLKQTLATVRSIRAPSQVGSGDQVQGSDRSQTQVPPKPHPLASFLMLQADEG